MNLVPDCPEERPSLAPSRRKLPLGLWAVGLAVAGSSALAEHSAQAEPSAWVSVNGGVSVVREGQVGATTVTSTLKPYGSMSFDAGLGTTPLRAIIVGFLFRVTPIVSAGTDIALYARVATRGFQVGDFGVAIDLGSYLRTWGPDPLPTTGFTGDVVLGGPFGTQLTLNGSYGMGQAYGFGATFGIDLLRLTVFRQTALQYWPNTLGGGAQKPQSK